MPPPVEIKTFRPTWEQFQNFSAYIDHIEREGGQDAGVCKVIPPREWVARRQPCDDEHIGNLPIPDPIEQRISGKLGVYDMTNYVQDPLTVKEYRAESMQLENQPPMGPLSETEDEYKKRLERHFWKNVCFRPAVYGADVNGSITDSDCSVWNINKLGTVLDKVLAAQKISIRGVNTAYIYYGRYKAAFPWHTEDQDLYSINLIHYGAPKLWYAVPLAYAKRFEALMNSYYPAEQRKCKAFLRHKRFLLAPSILKTHNIPYNTMLHKQGEIMLTFPGGYHAGFNCGFNIAESTNFATERWIPHGISATHCYCTEDTVNIDMSSFLETYNKDFGGKFEIPADLAEKQDKDEDAAIEALEKYDVDPEIYDELSDESDAAEVLVERAARHDDDYVPNDRSDDDVMMASDYYRRKKLVKRKTSQHDGSSSSGRSLSQRPTVVRHRMGGTVRYHKAPASLSSTSAVSRKQPQIGKNEHIVSCFSVSDAMLIAAGDDDDSGDEDWKANGDEMAHLRAKRSSNNNSRNSNSRSPLRRRRSSPVSPRSNKRKPSYKFTQRTTSVDEIPAGFVIDSPPKNNLLQHVDEAVAACVSPQPTKSKTTNSSSDKRKRRGDAAASGRSVKRNKTMPISAEELYADDADDEQSKTSKTVPYVGLPLTDDDESLPPIIEKFVDDRHAPADTSRSSCSFGTAELPYASCMPPKLSSSANRDKHLSEAAVFLLPDNKLDLPQQMRHCGLKLKIRSSEGGSKSRSNAKSANSAKADQKSIAPLKSFTTSSVSNGKTLPAGKNSKNVSPRRRSSKPTKSTALPTELLDLIKVIPAAEPTSKPPAGFNSVSAASSRDLAVQSSAAPEQKYRPSRMSPINKIKKKSMLRASGPLNISKLKHEQPGAKGGDDLWSTPPQTGVVVTENVWAVPENAEALETTPANGSTFPAEAVNPAVSADIQSKTLNGVENKSGYFASTKNETSQSEAASVENDPSLLSSSSTDTKQPCGAEPTCADADGRFAASNGVYA